MDKEKAKKQVCNCFVMEMMINPQVGLQAMLLDDKEKLEELRNQLLAVKQRCDMYCREIDACVDEKEIEKVLGSVTL